MTTNARYCDACSPYAAYPSRPAPARRTARWQRLARSFREQWVREHGWTCAGWKRPPHAVPPPLRGERSPLHVDHVDPLVHGGPAFDRANLQCLCAPCNGRKAGH